MEMLKASFGMVSCVVELYGSHIQGARYGVKYDTETIQFLYEYITAALEVVLVQYWNVLELQALGVQEMWRYEA